MDAGDLLVEQSGALGGGVVDADAFDGVRVAMGAVEGADECRGEAGAGGEFGHAFHALEGGDGHDAGDDGAVDAGELAAVAEIEEVVVVEEQLGADVVGACVDFGFQQFQFAHAIGGGWVAFGEAGDADAEAAWVWVDA